MKFYAGIVWAVLTAMSVSVMAQSNSELDSELMSRIENSRQALQRLEERVSRERMALGRELDERESRVTELREQAETVQRRRDEKLLGLDQLESRLEQWRRQSNYQQHILMSYADEFGEVEVDPDTAEGRDFTRVLENSLERLQSYMQPDWQARKVVATDGAFVDMQVLSLGPVIVGVDPDNGRGALLNRDIRGTLTFARELEGSQLAGVESLRQTGMGAVTLDPTLGNAARIAGQSEGLMEHIGKGGMWAVPIIFFGFLSLVISIAKAIQLLRMPRVNPYLAQHIDKIAHLKDERAAQSLRKLANSVEGPQRRLIDIALKTPPSQQRDDLMVAYLMECRYRMERFMEVVATSAAISPLLGLLGTVSGMISTFKMMTIFGSGDASTVSGGISEALVTTELGLIVAIPSLVVSALLTRKIKSYSHKLESFTIKLSKVDFSGVAGKAVKKEADKV